MTLIEFPTDFVVKIVGEGLLKEKVDHYYSDLLISENKDPNVLCEITDINVEDQYIFGKPSDYYASTQNGYHRVTTDAEYYFNQDIRQIKFSPDTKLYKFYKLIEYIVRLDAIKKGYTLIHASGVDVSGKTIIFPAWRHTGKTNTLLTFLNEKNASYLSDDRLWVNSKGQTLGFSLPINMQPYNYNSFPELSAPTKLYNYRFEISRRIRDRTEGVESLPFLALYFFNEHYIYPREKKKMLSDLFTDIKFKKESEVDAIVFLQTTTKTTVNLYTPDSSHGTKMLNSISRREWNNELHQMVDSFDSLDEYGLSEKHKHLEMSELEVWQELCRNKEIFVLELPREEKWSKEGLSNKVKDELSIIFD